MNGFGTGNLAHITVRARLTIPVGQAQAQAGLKGVVAGITVLVAALLLTEMRVYLILSAITLVSGSAGPHNECAQISHVQRYSEDRLLPDTILMYDLLGRTMAS